MQLYHFTSDLAAGSVRVRPIIANPLPVVVDQPHVEWLLAEGLSDLAEYRAGVALGADSGCTLLFE
jgi:hypothetical protein